MSTDRDRDAMGGIDAYIRGDREPEEPEERDEVEVCFGGIRIRRGREMMHEGYWIGAETITSPRHALHALAWAMQFRDPRDGEASRLADALADLVEPEDDLGRVQ